MNRWTTSLHGTPEVVIAAVERADEAPHFQDTPIFAELAEQQGDPRRPRPQAHIYYNFKHAWDVYRVGTVSDL